MNDWLVEPFVELMRRGGVVMWPLLALCVVALTLILERCWFFVVTNWPGRLSRVDRVARLLRSGRRDEARRLVVADASVYGDAVLRLLEEPAGSNLDAAAAEAIEAQRRRLERYLPTLSTIITAAPMLGILGTVLGIISSFDVLAEQTTTGDPRAVSQGIAEALITTATGLAIALVTLFPFNAIRAQVDRTLSRIETLLAAALGGAAATPGGSDSAAGEG